MQSRIGKEAGLIRTSRFGACAPSCFDRKKKSSGSLIFLAFFLSSCSSFFTSNASNKNIKSYIDKVCLSSEGKGRLKSRAGKHLFRYESILNFQDGVWDMAFQLPIYGESMMSLSWNEKGAAKIKGAFYTQVMYSLGKEKDSTYQQALLKRFLKFVGLIGQLKGRFEQDKDFKIECVKKSCVALGKRFTWYQNGSEFVIKQKINDRLHLVFRSSQASLSHFEKLSFVLENTRKNFIKENPLELDLFLASCDSQK